MNVSYITVASNGTLEIYFDEPWSAVKCPAAEEPTLIPGREESYGRGVQGRAIWRSRAGSQPAAIRIRMDKEIIYETFPRNRLPVLEIDVSKGRPPSKRSQPQSDYFQAAVETKVYINSPQPPHIPFPSSDDSDGRQEGFRTETATLKQVHQAHSRKQVSEVRKSTLGSHCRQSPTLNASALLQRRTVTSSVMEKSTTVVSEKSTFDSCTLMSNSFAKKSDSFPPHHADLDSASIPRLSAPATAALHAASVPSTASWSYSNRTTSASAQSFAQTTATAHSAQPIRSAENIAPPLRPPFSSAPPDAVNQDSCLPALCEQEDYDPIDSNARPYEHPDDGSQCSRVSSGIPSRLRTSESFIWNDSNEAESCSGNSHSSDPSRSVSLPSQDQEEITTTSGLPYSCMKADQLNNLEANGSATDAEGMQPHQNGSGPPDESVPTIALQRALGVGDGEQPSVGAALEGAGSQTQPLFELTGAPLAVGTQTEPMFFKGGSTNGSIWQRVGTWPPPTDYKGLIVFADDEGNEQSTSTDPESPSITFHTIYYVLIDQSSQVGIAHKEIRRRREDQFESLDFSLRESFDANKGWLRDRTTLILADSRAENVADEGMPFATLENYIERELEHLTSLTLCRGGTDITEGIKRLLHLQM